MVRIRFGAVNQAAGGDGLVHSWQVEILDLGPQPSKNAQGRFDGRRDIAVETIPKVRARPDTVGQHRDAAFDRLERDPAIALDRHFDDQGFNESAPNTRPSELFHAVEPRRDPAATRLQKCDAQSRMRPAHREHDPLEVAVLPLISGRRSVMGWPSGTSIDSEDTLAFSALTGVRPMTEVFPLEQADEAYDRMMSGKARFRVVFDMI